MTGVTQDVLRVIRGGTEWICPGPWTIRLYRDSRTTCQYLPPHVDGDPDGDDRDSDACSKGDDHGCSQDHSQLPEDPPGP